MMVMSKDIENEKFHAEFDSEGIFEKKAKAKKLLKKIEVALFVSFGDSPSLLWQVCKLFI